MARTKKGKSGNDHNKDNEQKVLVINKRGGNEQKWAPHKNNFKKWYYRNNSNAF